ncbi:hypothetical protein Pmani_035744 [Petrolisthes manimaculis]|uniref:Uncharacterized protein n=1 Tax=Petrolisthes manimaculis TaxID=1843537 RepID=A0AAE1NL30_9EUCA|nr:hypothetical protein Pmani_035744 [Petrolisthes manimaculis]
MLKGVRCTAAASVYPWTAMGTNFTQEITRSGDTICAPLDSMPSLSLAGCTVTSHTSSTNGEDGDVVDVYGQRVYNIIQIH